MQKFPLTNDPYVDIPALIKWRGNGTTFVELLQHIPYLKGDCNFCFGNENTIAWMGVSETCVEALDRLEKTGVILIKPSSLLTYLVDGCALRLPLVTSNRKYKKPHWLPTEFSLTPAARNRMAA